jgi:hypothetical protein
MHRGRHWVDKNKTKKDGENPVFLERTYTCLK